MIPKTIHYCWFGKGEMPALNKRCIESWGRLKDYNVVRWDESNSPLHIKLLKQLQDKKQWAFMSDYVRLYALFNYGGLYLDTDIEIVKNFDELLLNQCFIGEESPGKYNNAVMGAQKKHVFVLECMDYMEKSFLNGNILYSPEVVTSVASSTTSDVKIYPSKFFYPYNPYREDSLSQLMYDDITDETFAIHHWSNSWKNSMTFIDYINRLLFKLKG